MKKLLKHTNRNIITKDIAEKLKPFYKIVKYYSGENYKELEKPWRQISESKAVSYNKKL